MSRANPPLVVPPGPSAGGLFKETVMEQQILNAEISLARQQRGLWLIDDAASAERAERLRLAIRRQAEALVATMNKEPSWLM
jgi:hypothetical protein